MGIKSKLLVCATLECETKEEMLSSMEKAQEEGVDLVELCVDSISFSHISELQHLFHHRPLPAIVSFRLTEQSWAPDMNKRPSFLEILKRLEKIKETVPGDHHWNIFTS